VLKRRVQLAFGSAIVILLVVGAVSYRSIFLSSESNRWVRHTHEVLENLQNLVTDMERIESSDRGFALTGEESYIESYRASVLSAGQDEATLRTVTKNNPNQQLQLPALEELMAQKIRLGSVAILLRQTKGIEAAADAIGSGRGQRIMTGWLGIVSKMQDEELQLLLVRNAESNIPVIVVSARDGLGNQKRALDGGAKAFLQKPVDDAELLAVIRQALGESVRREEPTFYDLGGV